MNNSIGTSDLHYEITLTSEDYLDWDDFCCMVQQVYACKAGWGMIPVIPVVDIQKTTYTCWNNPKEGIYSLNDGEPIEHGIKEIK